MSSCCRRSRRKRRRQRRGRSTSGFCGGTMRRLAVVSVLLPELIPLATRTGGDCVLWRRGQGGGRLAVLAYPSDRVSADGEENDDSRPSTRRGRRSRTRTGAAKGSLRRRAEEEGGETTDSREREGRSRQYMLEGGFNLPRGGLPLNRIINGNDVISRFRRPYAVNLGCCTGSLIAPDCVLTAAHCIGCIDSVARVGRYDLSDPYEDFEELPIKETFSHPLYDPLWTHHDYDVAVCILDGMSKVKPVVLDGEKVSGYEYVPHDGDDYTVLGWGLTDTGQFATKLQRATVQYDEDCGQFGPWITPRMMCAADHSLHVKDACEGDSGAPLLVDLFRQPLQVGILSWGERFPCNERDKPAVYTRVREVHSWIESEVCSRSSAPPGRLVAQRFICPDNDKESAIFLGVETQGLGFDGDEDEENIGALDGIGVEVVGQLGDLGVIIPAEPIDLLGSIGHQDSEENTEVVQNEAQQEKDVGGGNKKVKNNAKKNTKNKQK